MVAVLLGALSLFAQAFSGTWTCHSRGAEIPWVIAPAPGSAWTTVRWADQTSERGGTAYVGYIPAQKQWIYEDFHYDGSYAINSSPGPQNNVWTWTGTYYLTDQTMHGQVLWQLTSANRIDRTFKATINGKPQSSGDYCTKN